FPPLSTTHSPPCHHHLFLYLYPPHPDLHSFPTRRSSDLISSKILLNSNFHFLFPVPGNPGIRGRNFRDSRIPGLEKSGKFANTRDRKSTRLNSSHVSISYAVFCLKKKKHITREDLQASMR